MSARATSSKATGSKEKLRGRARTERAGSVQGAGAKAGAPRRLAPGAVKAAGKRSVERGADYFTLRELAMILELEGEPAAMYALMRSSRNWEDLQERLARAYPPARMTAAMQIVLVRSRGEGVFGGGGGGEPAAR